MRQINKAPLVAVIKIVFLETPHVYKYYKSLLKTAGIKKLIRIVALYHSKLYLVGASAVSRH